MSALVHLHCRSRGESDSIELEVIPYPSISSMKRRTTNLSALNSSGSILAMDVTAPEPLPPFPASVVDGYALVASDGEGVLEVLTTSTEEYQK